MLPAVTGLSSPVGLSASMTTLCRDEAMTTHNVLYVMFLVWCPAQLALKIAVVQADKCLKFGEMRKSETQMVHVEVYSWAAYLIQVCIRCYISR